MYLISQSSELLEKVSHFLTSQSPDVQDISYNLLADVLCRLTPGQLQAAGAQGGGPEAGGGLRQLRPLADGEAGAGLVGASTVLCNALIDGLVLGGDTCDGESPAGGDRRSLKRILTVVPVDSPPPH